LGIFGGTEMSGAGSQEQLRLASTMVVPAWPTDIGENA
jgi:hypothetical protein